MATLDFKGKALVQNYHLTVKYHELVPKKDKSLTDKVRLDDNLIIHGDNLKALKALLPVYAGKVKCIYIDVPYNTGSEGWAYNDNVNSPMMQEWLGNAVDREDMTRHDKWLCMMLPRLKLLRELLRDDGTIFISIDDNEQHRLRMLLDEVFGEENFISVIVVQSNKRGQTYKEIAKTHEYILVYSRSPDTELLEFEKESDALPYKDSKGAFDLWELRNRNPKFGRHNRPNLYYPIYVAENKKDENGNSLVSLTQSNGFSIKVFPRNSEGEDGCWRWGKEKVGLSELDGKAPVVVACQRRDGEWNIYQKSRKSTTKPKSLWTDTDVISEQGTMVLGELGLADKFQHPKPVELIKKCIQIATEPDDIVLDSFGGSGTTAHAILAQNKEDGGNRKFILVECEDYADAITAERVRRVIKGVRTASDENLKKGMGGTFSYFELGKAIEFDSILDGKNLPSYLELARYVFYTATGEEFDERKLNEKRQFVGESRTHEVFLFYKPDIDYLKKIALTLDRAEELGKTKGKRRLVFAPTKYLDQEQLDELRIDFAQLPFEIYKLAQ
jgi:adenine-specific DNA-methyltransferase